MQEPSIIVLILMLYFLQFRSSMTRMCVDVSVPAITNRQRESNLSFVRCQWDLMWVVNEHERSHSNFILKSDISGRMESNSIQLVRLHSARLRNKLRRNSPRSNSRKLQNPPSLLLRSTLFRRRVATRVQAFPSNSEAAAVESCSFTINAVSIASKTHRHFIIQVSKLLRSWLK